MNQIGYYSILISLFLSGYSVYAAIFGAKSKREDIIASAENAGLVVFGFMSLASAALLYALVTRDFQVEYVASYSSRSLPTAYTLAAFYAGQKGSLLFWSWVLSLYAAIVIFQNRNKNRELLPYVLAVMMTISFFFACLMVFVTNPFEMLPYTPADGRGLNPMLQNPGMIFHPPALFLGYVGFTVPFAFSLAALITGQLGDDWIKTTRKWTIISWFFLTAGNLLGMEWAYVELGWGGYWAWDPVENASFMPWIVGTAYLHSVMIQEKRNMLKVWNIVLILLTFLLTIFGTFITRSGIIASVHSFGESSLGWMFLTFLGIAFTLSVSLLIYRLPDLRSKNQLDSLLSRESSFLYNNLLFMGIAFAVFLGTIFPVISEAVRGVKITVGPPFFNAVVTPISLALLFLIGVCPLIAWRKTTPNNFLKKIAIPGAISMVGACLLYIRGIHLTTVLITLALCIFVSINLFLEFFNGTRTRHALLKEGYPKALWNLIIRNKRRYGGHIIHFGVVLLFMAISGSAFNMEKKVSLNKGESFKIKQYSLRYDALSEYPTSSRQRAVAMLTVFNDNHKVGVLSPEKSLYSGQKQPTTEVAIHSNLKEDLYVILASYDKNWATFKVLINPLVVWLWIGGGIMAFGTVIVMLPDHRKKGKLKSVDKEKA